MEIPTIPVAELSITSVLILLYAAQPLLGRCKSPWMQDFAPAEASKRSSSGQRGCSVHSGILSVCFSCGVILGVLGLIHLKRGDAWLRVASWALPLVLTVLSRPRVLPRTLLAITVTTFAASIASVIVARPLSNFALGIECGRGLIALAATCTILLMPFTDYTLSNDGGVATSTGFPTDQLRSPEDNLRLWQFMTVSWIGPLIKKSRYSILNEEDVWQLPRTFQISTLLKAFRNLEGSIFRKLLLANDLDLILTTILGILQTAAKVSRPILLQRLLETIRNSSNKSPSLLFAAAILLVRTGETQCAVLSSWYQRRAYERSRAEMMTAVYDKALRRTERSDDKNATSMGRVLNIVQHDCSEISERFKELSTVVTKPLEAAMAMVAVWSILGWASILGVAWVLIIQALSGMLIPRLMAQEHRRRMETDMRLQVTSQFIETIRHLRWYGWQSHWAGRVMDARRRELRQKIYTGLWMLVIATISNSGASLLSAVSFFAYTYLAGHSLTVEVAFPALQLLTMLGMTLRELPHLVTGFSNASVAMGRLTSYLDGPDKPNLPPSSSNTVELQHGTFSWPGSKEPVLGDVSLAFVPGVHVIVGAVGSGKSALLLAILGEMNMLSGTRVLPSSGVAYCAQNPWLQRMSIRDNILFSLPYDADRYNQVIEACELIHDLSQFGHGDQSQIGENGAGLSGGHKARIALARSVYSRASLLLLDDPLAALDFATAQSIVRNLFHGPLTNGRIVILATHRADLCAQMADRVIDMKDRMPRVVDAASISCVPTSDEQATTSTNNTEKELTEANVGDATDFIKEQSRASGRVPARVFLTFIKAGSLTAWLSFILMFIFYRLSELAYYWILKAWGEAASADPVFRLPNPEVNLAPWLIWNTAIALSLVLFFDLGQLSLITITYNSSKSLFAKVISKISKATFRFYDQTPRGRLMNRVTSDIGTLDGGIIMPLQGVAVLLISWSTSMLIIASTAPVFILFALATTAGFVLIFQRYFPASESLRRLQAVSLSPVMSNFGDLSDGLATIRAFELQDHFAEKSAAAIDTYQRIDHFYWGLQSWLTYRFDLLSACSNFTLTAIALYYNVSSGTIAFLLATAARFVDDTHGLCTLFGTVQMEFVAVERVVELLYIEEEPDGDIEPPAAWPKFGDDITFENVTIAYTADLEPSLRDVSFTIPGGSKCAIVGRTGSGKSTIALSLLATLRPASGSITVGGVDMSRVNVHAWRRRITFVAQDPVLFEGTLRQNLDPLQEFSDDECAAALHLVLEWADLSFVVESAGKNLSQGQRQLVGIGRALLRRSPVVILDEATASVDGETLRRIQTLLEGEVKESTIIVISHHPDVIGRADYVISLSNGRVVDAGPRDNR